MNMVQELFLLLHAFTQSAIASVTRSAMLLFNIPPEQEPSYLTYVAKFYQDHSNDIFRISEEQIKGILTAYKESCLKAINYNYSDYRKNRPAAGESEDAEANVLTASVDRDQLVSDLEELCSNEEFTQLIVQYHKLCVFMNLNDPRLELPIQEFMQREYSYKIFKK